EGLVEQRGDYGECCCRADGGECPRGFATAPLFDLGGGSEGPARGEAGAGGLDGVVGRGGEGGEGGGAGDDRGRDGGDSEGGAHVRCGLAAPQVFADEGDGGGADEGNEEPEPGLVDAQAAEGDGGGRDDPEHGGEQSGEDLARARLEQAA